MAMQAGGVTGKNLLCDALGRPIPGSEPASAPADAGGAPTDLADLLAQQDGGDDGPRWLPLVLLKPPGLEAIIGAIKPPLQVISALLQVISAFLEVLAAILIGLLDPYRALVLAAYTLLKNLVEDLIHAGFYMYFDAPGITSIDTVPGDLLKQVFPDKPADLFRHGQAGDPPPPPIPDRFQQWGQRFAASFDDPGDLRRPILSNGASVAAVFVVGAVPSLEGLRQIMYLIGSLLNIKPFKEAVNRFKKGVPDPDLWRARQHSIAPDWKSKQLQDVFPPVRHLRSLPEMLRQLLLTGQGLSGLLKDMAAAIQAKVKVLQDLIAAIQAILDFLDALTSTGLYMLPVFTGSGPEGLQQAFVQAKNRPPGGYVGGACFLAAGPGISGAAILMNLLNPTHAGQNFEILEQAWAETKKSAVDAADQAQLKDKWNNLGDTAKKAKDDLIADIKSAPDKFADDFGSAGDFLAHLPETAPAEIVDLAKKAKKGLYDDPVKRADQAVQDARKKGPRSLALGVGATPDLRTPPKKNEPPPDGSGGGA